MVETESKYSIWHTGYPFFFSLGVKVVAALFFVYRFRATWLIRIWQRYHVWMSGVSEHLLKITEDLQISYMERKAEKNAKVLLLIHGFTGNKENYCDLARLIPKDFHIIMVDLPGHGESKPSDENGVYTIDNQVENLHKFVKAFGFGERKINMIGFSMGGHIAGVYAARYGDTLSSVVLACPSGINSPEITQFVVTSRENMERNVLLPRNAEEFQEMLKCVVYHNMNISDHFAEAFVKLKQPRMPVYKKVFHDLVEPSQHFVLDSVLENIEVPVLCVWGDHDQILHISGSEVIKKRVRNAEVQIVERCGHAISLDRPKKFLKITLEFLGKINT